MTHDEAPAVTPTGAIAKQVRDLRNARSWTAQQLAEKVTAAGLHWDRSVVANLENGRRRSVSVDEWLTLSFVLGVAPVHLVVPIDDSQILVTPDSAAGTVRARDWIRGETPSPFESVGHDHDSEPWKSFLAHMPRADADRVAHESDQIGDLEARVEGLRGQYAENMRKLSEHRTTLENAKEQYETSKEILDRTIKQYGNYATVQVQAKEIIEQLQAAQLAFESSRKEGESVEHQKAP